MHPGYMYTMTADNEDSTDVYLHTGRVRINCKKKKKKEK